MDPLNPISFQEFKEKWDCDGKETYPEIKKYCEILLESRLKDKAKFKAFVKASMNMKPFDLMKEPKSNSKDPAKQRNMAFFKILKMIQKKTDTLNFEPMHCSLSEVSQEAALNLETKFINHFNKIDELELLHDEEAFKALTASHRERLGPIITFAIINRNLPGIDRWKFGVKSSFSSCFINFTEREFSVSFNSYAKSLKGIDEIPKPSFDGEVITDWLCNFAGKKNRQLKKRIDDRRKIIQSTIYFNGRTIALVFFDVSKPKTIYR